MAQFEVQKQKQTGGSSHFLAPTPLPLCPTCLPTHPHTWCFHPHCCTLLTPHCSPFPEVLGVSRPSLVGPGEAISVLSTAHVHAGSVPGLLTLAIACVLLQVVFHDVGVLTDKLFPVVEAMQKHFSAGSGTYYSDSIFFLSVAMHQIMPKGNLSCGAAGPGV